MHITGIYTALCVLLVLLLAGRVSLLRHGRKIGFGDGGDADLARSIRVHANAIENLPLAMLMLLLLELGQTDPMMIHVFGIVLLVSRVLHAWGLSGTSGRSVGRFYGTLFTWVTMIAMAVLLLWKSVLVRL